MQDNWYSNDNWYAPNRVTEEQKKPPEVQTEVKTGKKRRMRIIALLAVVAVLAAAGLAAILGLGGKAEPKNAETPEWPDDFHEYFEKAYTTVTGKYAEIDIPAAEESPEFSLTLSESRVGQSLSLQQIYEKCSPSVVAIKGSNADGSGYSWGTGIILSADGLVVTNTHVLDGCDAVSVELYDGTAYDALLVGADSVSDISVLKIDADNLTAAEFAAADGLKVGDSVVALGNPLGKTYRLTMTNGIISGISREVSYNGYSMNLLQTNAAINEGNSGGPLINDKGQVVGITNMKMVSAYSSIEGIGFAIPTDTIKSMVDGLLSEGAIYGRATLGITIGPVREDAAKHYNIPNGLYVSEVLETSDADRQGMRPGDIIVSVDGTEVHSNDDVAAIKDAHKIGDTMKFELWRNGKTITLEIALMDANDIYK